MKRPSSPQTLDLLSLAKTKQEAAEVINCIENLSPFLFNKKIKLDKKLDQFFSLEQKNRLKALAKSADIDLGDNIKAQEFFQQIKEMLGQMPVVSLTLAFDPKPENITSISDWLTFNTKTQILLDYCVNPKLIGGCIVVYKGFYKDASLRKKLSESSL